MSREETRLVQFAEEFSAELVGTTFEVDEIHGHDATNNGEEYVGLRTKVDGQWGYRLGYVRDLRNLDGTPFTPDGSV